MWISSNKWKALEKRIADLEREVQNHRNVLIKHLEDYEQENKDFRNILESLKKEVEKEIMLAGHASKNIKPVSVDVNLSGKPVNRPNNYEAEERRWLV